jgi:acetyl-CoA carboxylase biotin carboxyl carrier protein
MQVLVRSDMSATVLEVTVAPGVAVDDGDTLLMLEAMKMELPVVATGRGVVRSVHVGPGDVVAEDQLLVTLEA